MKAQPGDRLIIRRLDVGAPPRDGEILEVRGENGGPPYLVRWSDDAQEGLIFPGSDALVQHFEHAADPTNSTTGLTEPANQTGVEER